MVARVATGIFYRITNNTFLLFLIFDTCFLVLFFPIKSNDLIGIRAGKPDFFQKKLSLNDAQAAEEELLKKYPIVNEYRDALSTVNHLGDDPREAYARLMGEAEARLTQTRKDLTPEERRKYFPFELQDKNLNPYGLDFPLNTLIHLDQTGKLVEKGLLGQ